MPAPFSTFQKVLPGTVVSWKQPRTLAKVLFNGMSPTKIPTENRYFGGVGLKDRESVMISGVWKESYSVADDLFKEISPYPSYYFVNVVKVQPMIKNPDNHLRLPSSVWKRVQVKDKSTLDYRKKLRKLWRNDRGPLTSDCWTQPLHSHITSPFGKARTLPNGVVYFHTGVDLRAWSGTTLRAIADGVVALAQKSAVPGNTVIIYHGGGVYSQFMHMSKIEVKPNQKVKKGEVLGLSGSTGRAEGPHLHWEMHWNGRTIDPFSFVKTIGHHCGLT